MPNYANNTNYLLWSDNLPYDQLYVGHTTDPIEKRLERHEQSADCSSRRIIEAGSYHIRVLEEWPCETREQALWRERWWIEITPCINKNLPIRTKEEVKIASAKWSKENPEKHALACKQWHKDNPEKMKQKSHKWRQKNLQKCRQKDVNLYKDPVFRQRKKEYKKQPVECACCNSIITRGGFSHHTNRCYTRFCKAFDIDADFKGIQGGIASE